MIAHLEGGVSPLEISYEFVHTFAWEEVRQLIERASGGA